MYATSTYSGDFFIYLLFKLTCMICGKQIYVSRTAAKEAISGINNDRFLPLNEHTIERQIISGGKIRQERKLKSKKSSMRSYYCDPCKGWHITTNGKKTKPKKPSNTATLNTFHKNEKGHLKININSKNIRIYELNKFKIK